MLLNCFDVVNSSHALVVGVNLVGQENNANSLANYWLAMRFVRCTEKWTRHCMSLTSSRFYNSSHFFTLTCALNNCTLPVH